MKNTIKVSSGYTAEQVLDALARCATNLASECAECPYRAQCLSDEATGILHDAAELIKILMGESQ